MQAAVDAKLARVRVGNLGDCKNVGKGVTELRIHIGPGLRVYYATWKNKTVVSIGGGDKETQTKDIQRAQALWQRRKETSK